MVCKIKKTSLIVTFHVIKKYLNLFNVKLKVYLISFLTQQITISSSLGFGVDEKTFNSLSVITNSGGR